jgi:MOSC domain-containing protein YiiM
MAGVTGQETIAASVLAISVSRERGVPKTNVPAAQLVEDWGIQDDAHAGPGHRQVSLLAIESIEKMRARGLDVRPGAFAENITTEFLDIPRLQVGDRLRIAAAELEVTQIGKECHSRCAVYYAAGDCVMPREGVFARVVRGGEIRVGASVEVISSTSCPAAKNDGGTDPLPEPTGNR